MGQSKSSILCIKKSVSHPPEFSNQIKKVVKLNLPFPRMLGSVEFLGGGVGDRGPSLGSAPFTCLSRSILMCSIQRRGRPTLRRACRVSMAAVAVDTVESMMGAGSPSHSSSASSSSLSSFSPSSSSPCPGERPALTASWTPPLG